MKSNETKLCPFRKTTKHGMDVENTRFDDCYGPKCMAYQDGYCILMGPKPLSVMPPIPYCGCCSNS